MKENEFDYNITDYDSETDTYELTFNLNEEEYAEIRKDYEKYLKLKANTADVLSFDEFFETVLNIGIYTRQLEIKKEYLKLLKSEIENLEKTIDDLELKL